MFGQHVEKVAVFIDAVNLDYTIKSLNLEGKFNWLRFKQLFNNRNTYCVCMRYYTAIDELPNGERPIQRLLDFLSDNGYELVTKKAKAYTSNGTRRVKGNIDVDLTCDVMQMASLVDRVVLVTGDGDFAELVRRVQLMGKRVTVVSSRESNPPMLSGDLRRAATNLIDLADKEVLKLICGEL